jgi:competence protein ComEC
VSFARVTFMIMWLMVIQEDFTVMFLKKIILNKLIIFTFFLLSNSACVKADSGKLLKVHFIDVGDADCILVESDNKSMMIDAGNNDDSTIINEYVRKLGVNKIDVLVGTHFDEDHIGSMDSVIENFDVHKIYMPKLDITNKDLEDVLLAIQEKGLQISEPIPEETFNIGNSSCTILGPVSSGYEKSNNYSIVIKLSFGSTSFLFTGDAEKISEKEMMRRGFDLSADLLKLGHHGSISSTTKEFLERVNPKYAVLTSGRDNKYVHPHKRTMINLKDKGIKVYRTDESGTIIAESDGYNITFNAKPGSYSYKTNTP